jgi:hypothetical protein
VRYTLFCFSRWLASALCSGQFIEGEKSAAFRSFSPTDATRDAKNGIQVSDVGGSFTNPVKISAPNGVLTFTPENQTTLSSYSGQNLLGRSGIQVGVVNPSSGNLATKTQTFIWRVPIPTQYRKP